jgi:F0F1-type ATP synthase assembly protein I
MEEETISILDMPARFGGMHLLERRLVLLLLVAQVVCVVKLQLLLPRQTRLKLVLGGLGHFTDNWYAGFVLFVFLARDPSTSRLSHEMLC